VIDSVRSSLELSPQEQGPILQVAEAPQLIENVGGPARIRTLDQRIMSSPEPSRAEEDKALSPAKQGKVRQKSQLGRNQDTGKETA
jgi:hypothetical protein